MILLLLFNPFLKALENAWNALDVGKISSQLHPEVVYHSQWDVTIFGKTNVVRHYSRKFSAIRERVQQGSMVVQAQLGYLPESGSEVLLLTQMEEGKLTQASVILEILDKKISKISVCYLPLPEHIMIQSFTKE